jgi:hypothetical protein
LLKNEIEDIKIMKEEKWENLEFELKFGNIQKDLAPPY